MELGNKIAPEITHRVVMHQEFWRQVKLLLAAVAVSVLASWYTYDALADFWLAVVAGSVGFVTVSPMMAAMSDRPRGNRRRI